jgi:tetratricopeptide (TPR) repeat protein
VLGDALLAAGKGKEAFAEFEKDLSDHPNRALALLGAARAAKVAGDPVTARARYAALADLWRDAETDVPALAEVRGGATVPSPL